MLVPEVRLDLHAAAAEVIDHVVRLGRGVATALGDQSGWCLLEVDQHPGVSVSRGEVVGEPAVDHVVGDVDHGVRVEQHLSGAAGVAGVGALGDERAKPRRARHVPDGLIGCMDVRHFRDAEVGALGETVADRRDGELLGRRSGTDRDDVAGGESAEVPDLQHFVPGSGRAAELGRHRRDRRRRGRQGAGARTARRVELTPVDQLLFDLGLIEAVERRDGRRILRTEALVDREAELCGLVGDDLDLVSPVRRAPPVLGEEGVALVARAGHDERGDLDAARTRCRHVADLRSENIVVRVRQRHPVPVHRPYRRGRLGERRRCERRCGRGDRPGGGGGGGGSAARREEAE